MNKNHGIAFLACVWLHCATAAADTQLSDDQLSHIQFDQKIGAQVTPGLTFTDETGRQVRLGAYFGNKPTVLILGYYGCPMLCTLVLNGAADCFRNMTWKAGREFNVIFVSVNPDEKPVLAAEKKASYVNSYGRDCAGDWHFLTGGQKSITSLASEAGFEYIYDAAAKQYAHPSGLIILTDEGKVAKYLFGINFAARDLDNALRAAAINQTGAAESQFTLLCFHYAPIHGKYGKLIMETVRGCGILMIVVLTSLLFIPATRRKLKKPE